MSRRQIAAVTETRRTPEGQEYRVVIPRPVEVLFDPECPDCASPGRCPVHDPIRPEDE